MKEGDKIIWDSDFGYEVGYYIKESDFNIYNTYLVNVCTGIVTGECMHPKHEIIAYNPKNLAEMQNKYGYEKKLIE